MADGVCGEVQVRWNGSESDSFQGDGKPRVKAATASSQHVSMHVRDGKEAARIFNLGGRERDAPKLFRLVVATDELDAVRADSLNGADLRDDFRRQFCATRISQHHRGSNRQVSS
jgi:hypothetical protein